MPISIGGRTLADVMRQAHKSFSPAAEWKKNNNKNKLMYSTITSNPTRLASSPPKTKTIKFY